MKFDGSKLCLAVRRNNRRQEKLRSSHSSERGFPKADSMATSVVPVLCVIPARGGSKGLPRKNLRQVCGRPLLEWTIEAAQSAQLLDRFVVSTEDPEIAVVAA